MKFIKNTVCLLAIMFVFHKGFAQDKVTISSDIDKILLKARDHHNNFFDGMIALQEFYDDISVTSTKVTMLDMEKTIFYRTYFWKDAKWSNKPVGVIEKDKNDGPKISRVLVKFPNFGDVYMERLNGLRTPTDKIILFCLDEDAGELKKLIDKFVALKNK